MSQTQLKLIRHTFDHNRTIGKLYLNNKYFCDTIELCDRKLVYSIDKDDLENQNIVRNNTAIPYGIYKVNINIPQREFINFKYAEWSQHLNYKIPIVEHVPNFGIVRIHPNDTLFDRNGDIRIGNWKNNKMINGNNVIKALYNNLSKNNNEIYLEITHV